MIEGLKASEQEVGFDVFQGLGFIVFRVEGSGFGLKKAFSTLGVLF